RNSPIPSAAAGDPAGWATKPKRPGKPSPSASSAPCASSTATTRSWPPTCGKPFAPGRPAAINPPSPSPGNYETDPAAAWVSGTGSCSERRLGSGSPGRDFGGCGCAGGGVGCGLMTPDERWLAAAWPFVCAALPAAPARVLEVGCGPLG